MPLDNSEPERQVTSEVFPQESIVITISYDLDTRDYIMRSVYAHKKGLELEVENRAKTPSECLRTYLNRSDK